MNHHRNLWARPREFYWRHIDLLRTVGIALSVCVAVWIAVLEDVTFIRAVQVSWTILTFAGTIFASLNCREAVRDLRALLQSKVNGPLRLQGEGAVFDQGLKVIALGSNFVAGLFSFYPGTPVPLIMLCVSTLMMINLSFAQERRRARLIGMLRRIQTTQLDSIQKTGEDTNIQVTDLRTRATSTNASNDARMQTIEDNAASVAKTLADKEQQENPPP